MRLGCLVGLLACFAGVAGCGAAPSARPASVPINSSATDPVEPPPRVSPSLVDDEGMVSGYPDGPATLIGMGTRCVGEVTGGRLDGCELGPVRVALPGDAIATLLPPRSDAPPALAVDAPLHGEFPGLRFVIESEAGDALCPGSPTRIRFLDEDVLLGEVSLDSPITRQLGQGVVGLLVTPDEVFVLLHWGADSWRLVTTSGETVSEGRFGASAECDCCE